MRQTHFPANDLHTRSANLDQLHQSLCRPHDDPPPFDVGVQQSFPSIVVLFLRSFSGLPLSEIEEKNLFKKLLCLSSCLVKVLLASMILTHPPSIRYMFRSKKFLMLKCSNRINQATNKAWRNRNNDRKLDRCVSPPTH